MEPTEGALRKDLRIVLKLGKFQVIERTEFTAKVALGGSVYLTINDPILPKLDFRAGDILTFYTEVPLAEPKSTSIK